VYTWVNGGYQDRKLFGDRLADYVDGGGHVVLGAFCTFTAGNSLGGRLMTAGYSPVTSVGGFNHFAVSDYNRDGTSCLFSGVTSFGNYFRDFLVTQGGGIVDGHYQDGEIAVAHRADFRIVYTNGTGASQLGGCMDLWPRLVPNACLCGVASAPPTRPVLYGTSADGQLFTVDVTTGKGNWVGNLPSFAARNGATEIEYDKFRDRSWLQMKDGTFFDQGFDITTGAGAGAAVPTGASFTGLEYVLFQLYGTAIAGRSGPPGAKKILYAPSEVDDLAFRNAIAGGSGATVDYLDARSCTPTVEFLGKYDCVYTWADYAYADRTLFGDRLAEYVDAGGRVILGVFCTYTSGSSLGGRIMTAAYSPVVSPSGSNHFVFSSYDGNGDPCIHFGISSGGYGCTFRDFLTTQGGAVVAGRFVDGEIAVAYRPDLAVIYVNGTGGYPLSCGGLWGRLLGNAARCTATPLASTLRTLDPATGASVVVGATGLGSIVGLAADPNTGSLYGITGGENRKSRLVTLDLATGAATVVGMTGFDAASLEFGPDGNLYGGGSGLDGGRIYRIDKLTGAAAPVGPTGFGSVSGLTLVEPVATDLPEVIETSSNPRLYSVGPNPSRRELAVSFFLPSSKPAMLELIDVRGRRVLSREVGPLGKGIHAVDLFDKTRPAAGIYIIRLSQGPRSASTKTVVLQ
jgi:hypothetical protein